VAVDIKKDIDTVQCHQCTNLGSFSAVPYISMFNRVQPSVSAAENYKYYSK